MGAVVTLALREPSPPPPTQCLTGDPGRACAPGPSAQSRKTVRGCNWRGPVLGLCRARRQNTKGPLSRPLFDLQPSLLRPSDLQGACWVCRAAGLSQFLEGASWDAAEVPSGGWGGVGAEEVLIVWETIPLMFFHLSFVLDVKSPGTCRKRT